MLGKTSHKCLSANLLVTVKIIRKILGNLLLGEPDCADGLVKKEILPGKIL